MALFRKIAIYFLYTLAGYILVSHIHYIQVSEQTHKEELEKFYTFYDVDVVPEKPFYKLIVPKEKVYLYNNFGVEIGFTQKKAVVFSNVALTLKDSLHPVTIYGWMWTESLKDSVLICDENVRCCANFHVISRLIKGEKVNILYTNEINLWQLVMFQAFSPKNQLISMEQFKSFSWWKRNFATNGPYETITKRYGGVSVKNTGPIFQEVNLRLPFRIVLLLLIAIPTGFFIFFFPLKIYTNRKRALKSIMFRFIMFLVGAGIGGFCWIT